MLDGANDQMTSLGLLAHPAHNGQIIGLGRNRGEDDLFHLGAENSGDILRASSKCMRAAWPSRCSEEALPQSWL